MEGGERSVLDILPHCTSRESSLKNINSTSQTSLIQYNTCREVASYLCYTILAVSFFALLLNVVNLRVFHKIGFRSTIYICYIYLSSADLLSCFLNFNIGFAHLENIDHSNMIVSFKDLQMFFSVAYIASCSLSSWATALISLERVIAITFPFKVARLFTRKTTTGLLVGGLVYQLIVVIPHYWTMGLVPSVSPDTNKTKYVFDIENFDLRVTAISLFFSFSLPTLVCFLVIIVSTVVLAVQLRRRALLILGMSAEQSRARLKQQVKASRTAFIVCLVHLTCFSPFVATFCASVVEPAFSPGDPRVGNMFYILHLIGALSHMVSCLANFFVYLASNSKFQDMLKNILHRNNSTTRE